MKKLVLTLLLVFGMVLAVGCSDDNTGDDTLDNANEQNDAGNTNGDAIGSSGLGDLEMVSAISEEWLTGAHAKSTGPVIYAGARGYCGTCHSGNALERYGSDNPYKAEGIDSGEKRGTFVIGKDSDIPTPMGCATCHSGAGGDILESGVVPVDLAGAFGGEELDTGNSTALCFTCHNARRDVDHLYEVYTGAVEVEELETEYPHHGWSSLVTGQGGIEYPDVEYAQSGKHLDKGCVGCHMPETDEGYTSHTFTPDTAGCADCHGDFEDFQAGLTSDLEPLLAELEELVLANIPGAVEIGSSHGKTPAIDADGNTISPEGLAPEALIGAYNWAVVKQELDDGGKGMHNPTYAKSLLQASIDKLKALQ